MAAQPGGKSYGRLSVMTQYWCEVQPLFDVPASSFRPRPKVQSSFVRLIPLTRLPALAVDEELLAAVVRDAFAKRRKTLRNALKAHLGSEDIESLAIDPGTRAEQVSISQFVELANLLHRIRAGQQ